jgi:hypothetical protein
MNHKEADFRVVGSLGSAEDDANIWAVECQASKEDFWGVECPRTNADNPDDTAFIQCRACGKKANRRLTFMEHEVIGSAGIIILHCEMCGKPTYWVDANSNRIQSNFQAVEPLAPQSDASEFEKTTENEKPTEKRAAKRTGLKLSIHVRNETGEEEVSRLVDISKFGVGVALFMKLKVGDTLKIICPYDPRSGGIEQTAQVCWRSRYYNQDFPRTYGLRFASRK